MKNKNLLEASLNKKFANMAFEAITTYTFINSLPFNSGDMVKEDFNGFKKYFMNVIESLGGFESLCSNKFDNVSGEINAICREIANEAAKRCTEEITGSNDDKKMSDIIDGVDFNDEEYKKLTSNADAIGVDKIADVIKDKVIKTIRNEKNEYEKQEETKNELKEAICNSEDDDKKKDEAVESYMNLVLSKSDPRCHVSLFSKLQDVAYTALSHTTEAFTEIPFKTMTEITLKNTLDDFKPNDSLSASLESAGLFTNPYNDRSDTAEASVLCAVSMYTALETLNTLGLYSPSAKSVNSFISLRNDAEKFNNASALESEIKAEVSKLLANCNKTSDVAILTESYDMLTTFNEQTQNMSDEFFGPTKESLCEFIGNAINTVSGKLDSINSASKNVAVPNQYDERSKDRTVAQFNKVNSLYGKNPIINNICLHVNPACESVIDVICTDSHHNQVDKSFIDVEYAKVYGSYIDFVKEAFAESKLHNCSKSVSLYIEGGSGKLINL